MFQSLDSVEMRHIIYKKSMYDLWLCVFLSASDNRIVLESVKCPGQHVGIKDDGEAKKPDSTGKGKHGQFQPKVIHEVFIVV